MPAQPDRSPWDFSEALQLLNHLPVQKPSVQHHVDAQTKHSNVSHPPLRSTGLGDFSKIWAFLGKDNEPPGQLTPLPSEETAPSNLDLPDPNRPPPPGPTIQDDAYNSDGAVYAKKNVRWEDEFDVTEVTDEPHSQTSDDPGYSSPSKATKSKKAKKAEKKALKKTAKKEKDKKAATRKATSDVDSEAEVRQLKKPSKPSPAGKASVHSKLPTPPTTPKPIEAPETPTTPKPDDNLTPRYNLRSKSATPSITIPSTPNTSNKSKKRAAEASSANSSPGKSLPQLNLFGGHLVPGPITPKTKAGNPYLPVQDGSQPNTALLSPVPLPPTQSQLSINLSPKQAKRTTRKFTIWPKEDRELQLLFRLVHDFGEDKKWLAKPVHLANHLSSPVGIHVFVDFSNIWIGFMEYLKYLPKPPGLRIPHQNISFDSLVLLLERRRPVGKRVLAGSAPLLPAMELAKAIGYETNILDKVYKARELSEKQKRYLVINALRRGNSGPVAPAGIVGGDGCIVNNGNTSSGSETCYPTTLAAVNNAAAGAVTGTPFSLEHSAITAVHLSPEKWVEQGVDEILHLKILESIVDTDKPSTMVVATGDAAKAEYSEGFMKMITRALKKNWKVELVAWSKSISMEYRRPEFQRMWAANGQFRIIELDEYAEFLLDT